MIKINKMISDNFELIWHIKFKMFYFSLMKSNIYLQIYLNIFKMQENYRYFYKLLKVI